MKFLLALVTTTLFGSLLTIDIPSKASGFCEDIRGARVVAEDGTYLGKIDYSYEPDSIFNDYGIYGVFTIESMALGKPVICTLTNSFYSEYDLPVISVNPINLAKKITELYNNRESLVDIGKTSYDFVQSHHNPIASAKKVIERYKAVLD